MPYPVKIINLKKARDKNQLVKGSSHHGRNDHIEELKESYGLTRWTQYTDFIGFLYGLFHLLSSEFFFKPRFLIIFKLLEIKTLS
jgi:hypothetical protein